MSYMSPYGKITSEWKVSGNKVIYNIEVPGNMTAEVILGDNTMIVQSGKHCFEH
ncbi:Bacterial alpha-L-rhamnosidase [compost metagenome]